MRDARYWLVVIASVAILAAAAFFYLGAAHGGVSARRPDAGGQVRADSSDYRYINPLLYSDSAPDASPAFKALASAISASIGSTTAHGAASAVSVYFRDLNTGRWVGVDENDRYAPSSMLKVIAMLAALKLAENDPSLLSRTLMYRKGTGAPQYYPPQETLSDGPHTIDDLIRQMIVHSDNDALAAILSDKTIDDEFTDVYRTFRLPDAASDQANSDFMSPKSFAVVFRVLYNSSFFQWSLSEQVLSLLAQTDFTAGLVAGVPAGTPVARKFGENTNVDASTGAVIARELHDCGVVYYPSHPYLLCVMTRGQDYSRLEAAISGVSSAVWSAVSKELYPQG